MSLQVIRLNDCIRVSDADVEGCPRDCGPFLVETTEKTFVFAVETAELEDWMQKLCEIAFPVINDEGMFPLNIYFCFWQKYCAPTFREVSPYWKHARQVVFGTANMVRHT